MVLEVEKNELNNNTTEDNLFNNKMRLKSSIALFNNHINKNILKIETFKNRENKLNKDYLEKSEEQADKFLNYVCKIKNENNRYIIKDTDFFSLLDKENLLKDIVKAKKSTDFLDKKYKIQASKWITKAYAISERNADKIAVMLTFTGLTKNLYYKQQRNTKKIIKNNNCIHSNSETAFHETMKDLTNIRRDFYLRFKKALAKRKITTQLAKISHIEITKAGNPHLHEGLYLESSEQFKILVEVYKRVVRDIQKNQVQKYQSKLSRTKARKNEKGKKSTQSMATYITKYIIKDLKNMSKYYAKYSRFYRFFTTSNLDNTLEEIELVYKYLKNNNIKLINKLKKENKNVYNYIDNMLNNGKFVDYEYKLQNAFKTQKLKDYKEQSKKRDKITINEDLTNFYSELVVLDYEKDKNEQELIKNNYHIKKSIHILFVKIDDKLVKIYDKQENIKKYTYDREVNRLLN